MNYTHRQIDTEYEPNNNYKTFVLVTTRQPRHISCDVHITGQGRGSKRPRRNTGKGTRCRWCDKVTVLTGFSVSSSLKKSKTERSGNNSYHLRVIQNWISNFCLQKILLLIWKPEIWLFFKVVSLSHTSFRAPIIVGNTSWKQLSEWWATDSSHSTHSLLKLGPFIRHFQLGKPPKTTQSYFKWVKSLITQECFVSRGKPQSSVENGQVSYYDRAVKLVMPTDAVGHHGGDESPKILIILFCDGFTL